MMYTLPVIGTGSDMLEFAAVGTNGNINGLRGDRREFARFPRMLFRKVRF